VARFVLGLWNFARSLNCVDEAITASTCFSLFCFDLMWSDYSETMKMHFGGGSVVGLLMICKFKSFAL
jgi:hypothetical protein